MNSEDKKKKAALAAVIAYLQAEEKDTKVKPNLWLRSGREVTMNNNILVQMRNFRR